MWLTIQMESASFRKPFTMPSRAELSSRTPGASTSRAPLLSTVHFEDRIFTMRTTGQKERVAGSTEPVLSTYFSILRRKVRGSCSGAARRGGGQQAAALDQGALTGVESTIGIAISAGCLTSRIALCNSSFLS